MNVISREKSIAVRSAAALEVGAVYQVKGTTLAVDKDKYGNPIRKDGVILFTRKPIPPQLVVIMSPPTLQAVKVHFYCDDGVQPFEYQTVLPLDEVNIPENGLTDRYLERIPDATVLSALKKLGLQNKQQNYMEMAMDRRGWQGS